jgi:hypothetical protein
LPILLAQLKELIKKKKAPPPPNEHEDPIVRPGPIPVNRDPYADEVLVESEEEVRIFVGNAVKKLALYDPILRTCAALGPEATVQERGVVAWIGRGPSYPLPTEFKRRC